MSHPEEIDIHAPPPLAAPPEAAPDPPENPPDSVSESEDEPPDDPPDLDNESDDDPPRILQIPLLEDLHGEEQLGGDVTPVFDKVAFAEAAEGEQAVAEADGASMEAGGASTEAEVAQPAAEAGDPAGPAGAGEKAKRLPKLAEWEDWHSHRLTKVKKKGVWTGWQLTCCRHSVKKDLCTRERTIPKRKNMVPGSAEFQVASDRVVEKLKHWAVQELHDDTKKVHMVEIPDVDDSDLMDHDTLETVGYLWHLELFSDKPASVSGGASAPASSGEKGSDSSGSSSSSSSSSSDSSSST